MVSCTDYTHDRTYPTYNRAKKRKIALKLEGYRVKIDKTSTGEFAVWYKDVVTIGLQERQGNGRNRDYLGGEFRDFGKRLK